MDDLIENSLDESYNYTSTINVLRIEVGIGGSGGHAPNILTGEPGPPNILVACIMKTLNVS